MKERGDESHADPRKGDVAIEDLLASQIAYYRAHAPKYDDWWRRTGKHDLGEDYRLRWEAEIAILDAFLEGLAPFGHVLEFAGGTGNWTAKLISLSESITVVDASPEAVAVARNRIDDPKVAWVVEDIFGYQPPRRYDTVFFSFWLSHVPPERFDQFWTLVDRCLLPTGRVFFIDNADPSLSSEIPEFEALWSRSSESSLAGIDSRTNLATGRATRLAADGSTYDLVKIWRTPEDVTSKLAALGWRADVTTTETAFIYGSVGRTSSLGE
jgi:demethylmenaquinone methyltransferase/2-methoxy-6-polyprenyl-1,4-benzoquinol methylase